MTEQNTATKDAPKMPVGDATIVHDGPVDEEKMREDLVAAVGKKLEKDAAAEARKNQPDVPSEKPGKPESSPSGEKAADDGESAGEKSEISVSKDLQSRAKKAGLSDSLVERLHESGQLEETLAAFDRSLIEYVQSKKKPEAKEPAKGEGQKAKPDDQEIPALDPDVYDEGLVKRDTYQQQRIDALEAQLKQFTEGQQDGFDDWFDGVLSELDVDPSDEEKCQTIFAAYGSICDILGRSPTGRDKKLVKQARDAMYSEYLNKEHQRKTADRLRDAEGKQIHPTKSRGGPPPKEATDEEVHDHLVSNVASYLKEQGVQMSGY